MKRIKSYTDFGQAKRLSEFLPPESADMCWVLVYDENHMMSDYRAEPLPYCLYSGTAIPCWSLSALLEVLPRHLAIILAISNSPSGSGIRYKFAIGSAYDDRYDCHADTAIDACVDMLEKLHGLKIL